MELLWNIVENQERTHVDSLQLARVLAPCFIHSGSHMTHGNKTASNQIKLTQVLQLLIENYPYLKEVWLPQQTDLTISHAEESKYSSFFSGSSLGVKMNSSGRSRSITKRANFMNKLRKHTTGNTNNEDDDNKNIYVRDSDKGILPEHQYALDGNLDSLQMALKEQPFLLKAKDDLGNTLLHYATMGVDGCGESSSVVAEYLLSIDPELQFVQVCFFLLSFIVF